MKKRQLFLVSSVPCGTEDRLFQTVAEDMGIKVVDIKAAARKRSPTCERLISCGMPVRNEIVNSLVQDCLSYDGPWERLMLYGAPQNAHQTVMATRAAKQVEAKVVPLLLSADNGYIERQLLNVTDVDTARQLALNHQADREGILLAYQSIAKVHIIPLGMDLKVTLKAFRLVLREPAGSVASASVGV